ncbi:hypothetical protein G3480_11995 [Thiorhodococcus mannitoliphagus]|uniref:Uncharacterized protein n=1 Tax=Thiorhodococcus mannitoliphagus TaxID=329406 RepID=A0A6P1DZ83_9GAMM|nr:hypothetical protein [Thiorhodococcus mannitoliphagus]NEX21024.1 hypothetical protein [Thiorhodococcus mannitoliphagus]
MTTILVIGLWSFILGLAAWRPDGAGRRNARWALTGVMAALLLSPFWWDWARGNPTMAGPETAFVSVWILVLLPILARRMDGATLGATLYRGLIAAAALGTALDASQLALSALPPEDLTTWIATALLLGTLTTHFAAGLGLCLLAIPKDFPWDYPAWFAGLLLMHQAATPIPIALDIGAAQGIFAVATALGIAGLVRATPYGRNDGCSSKDHDLSDPS